MYSQIHKVNGQDDINDYMLMEHEAYFKYSDKIRKQYFHKNKKILFHSKSILNFKIEEQFLNIKRDLFFTNLFTVNIQIIELNECKITTTHNFFNQNNQLCVTVKCNLIEIDVGDNIQLFKIGKFFY